MISTGQSDELNQSKCQAYGKCTATAPAMFGLDDNGKVRLAVNRSKFLTRRQPSQ
jgi:ferredoxin